jgi:pyruvate-ferredoxin/flavodoxin oxidoreductase
MGYDMNQALKAIREAEAYPGPSIIIAYSPCIEHGIKKQMSKSQIEAKEAVECGYWHTYRFNPSLKAEGKNPFTLDSKEPDLSKLEDFILGENRYASLKIAFPDKAQRLYDKAKKDAADRLDLYKSLAAQK